MREKSVILGDVLGEKNKNEIEIKIRDVCVKGNGGCDLG